MLQSPLQLRNEHRALDGRRRRALAEPGERLIELGGLREECEVHLDLHGREHVGEPISTSKRSGLGMPECSVEARCHFEAAHSGGCGDGDFQLRRVRIRCAQLRESNERSSAPDMSNEKRSWRYVLLVRPKGRWRHARARCVSRPRALWFALSNLFVQYPESVK
jgi:hypothetical protein